jgi:hypothetical protein
METLTCATCGGPLKPADAAPAPDGMPARFLFHADLADCWRIRKARAMAWKPGKSGLNDPPYLVESLAPRSEVGG